MLDALKFAFEILIVGTLALPWLAVLHRMCSKTTSFSFQNYLSTIPRGARDTLSIAVIIAFGYFLGSSVSRFSRDFFNDELWQPFPTENLIRDGVYYDEFCTVHRNVYKGWDEAAHLQSPKNFCALLDQDKKPIDDGPDVYHSFAELIQPRNQFDERVQEVFHLQEGELLLEGTDKVDRLKQYFDQITVLRGAAFNGCILFALCAIGFFGTLWDSIAHRWLRFVALLPPAALLFYALGSLIDHSSHSSTTNFYSDPPLAELVMLLLAGLGLYFVPKGEQKDKAFYARSTILAAVIAAVSFGGWWWTEVMYDDQVIHSEPELKRYLSGAARSDAHPSLVGDNNAVPPNAPGKTLSDMIKFGPPADPHSAEPRKDALHTPQFALPPAGQPH